MYLCENLLTFLVPSGRQAALASQTSPLARFLSLPSPARAASEQVAAHRSAITLYLTRRLSDVSNAQKSQQETRVRRQMERSAKGGLGSTGIDQLAKQRASEHKSAAPASSTSASKDEPTTDDVLSLYRPAPDPTVPDIDDILSPEQVQQFESEASALLEATNQELDAIRAAEASLLEISALQSELVVHLSQQTELTDRLWEEAVQVTVKVDEGNKQLRKARERNRESRLWVLAFLLGASATLLFIEFY
jgi:syntaxin 18